MAPHIRLLGAPVRQGIQRTIGIDAFWFSGRVQRALGVDVWLNLVRRGWRRVRVDRGLRFLGREWFSSRHNVGSGSPNVGVGCQIRSGPNPFRPGSDWGLTPRFQRLTRWVCENRFGSGMQAGPRMWSPDGPPHKEQGPHK